MSSVPSDAPAGTTSDSTAVAFEHDASASARTAHLVSVAMLDLGPYGLTVCGFPVEKLEIGSGVTWADIDAEQRCEHCAAESA
jgi:hypothetical protein